MTEIIREFIGGGGFLLEAFQYWPWVLVAFAVMLVLRFIIGRWQGRLEDRRLREQPQRSVEDDEAEGFFGSLTPAFAAQIPESEQETSDFRQLLRQAGLYSPGTLANIYSMRFVLLFLPLVFTGLMIVVMPSNYTVIIAVVGALVAAGLSIAPRLFVYYLQRKRVREIRLGLVDLMDMLSMCLSGGLPLSPSLDHLSNNLRNNYPALATELQILKRQAEVGSLPLALKDLASRVAIPEVRQLTSLLTRGEQLGSQLSNSLLVQADHFRSTRRQIATMQANKTPVKLSLPLMFCFAPATLILLMSPAMLELREFLRGTEGQSILADESRMVDSISSLAQENPVAPFLEDDE
jgi:tight adherence protein C|tara:strand:+ start:1236 stop:2285 length:1050 start_codon:yes stop_codon:yes gene_type:complete